MDISIPMQFNAVRAFDYYSRTNQLIIDGCIFACSLTAAFVIRFERWPSGFDTKQLLFWIPLIIAARLSINYQLGIYRSVWRFVSISDASMVVKSLSALTVLLLGIRILMPGNFPFSAITRLPLSIIALEFLMSLTACLSVRILRRMLYEQQKRAAARAASPPVRMILYGAGKAGILLLRELQSQRSIEVVGFVDDDLKKVGSEICGVRVLGTGQKLRDLRQRSLVDEVAISMATASRTTLLRIVAQCRQMGVPAKIIPSLHEIVERRVNIGQLRNIAAEDLLGRDTVTVEHLDDEAREVYRGKRILVTGAGGSIGSELVRQLSQLDPVAIAILDKDENSVYELEQELLRNSAVALESQIADIRNCDRLSALFSQFRPHVIFHAAAHKHVPLMQKHPCEAVLNNVIGTHNVLQAAQNCGAERFVFISTDKAVNPSSIMGATKRVGESLVRMYSNSTHLKTACVRFGNVLGSRGSVVPLFQRQIADGGPITITHPDIVRFFMTITEAVQLVLCAGTLANGGEVFVLDMGTPRKILDLAHELILFSGIHPDRNIEIEITGLRPGEKLSEELTTAKESMFATRFAKLSMVRSPSAGDFAFRSQLSELAAAAKHNDASAIYEVLSSMNIGFSAHSEVPLARSA